MFNEKDFKNYILGIKVKKLLCMLTFSIIGCAIGVITSSYIIDILLFDWNLRPLIIAISTIIFFFISLLITSNSNRYIQDSYLKMETLNTLNRISTKLDTLELIEKNNELQSHSTVIDDLKKSIANDKTLQEITNNEGGAINDTNNLENTDVTKEEKKEEPIEKSEVNDTNSVEIETPSEKNTETIEKSITEFPEKFEKKPETKQQSNSNKNSKSKKKHKKKNKKK